MTQRPSATASLTQAGLNLIQQALSIYDSDLRLAVCNRPFRAMFDLPLELVTPGATFEDTIRYLLERGEYGDVPDIEVALKTRVDQARAFEPHYMERTRPNGRTISVEGSPLPEGGWVTVYTDITSIKQQEALLRARSEELSDQVLTHAERLSQTNRALEATIATLEETKRQLVEMESRTRMTTEMMPAHIAHVDLSGHYTYSNRRLSSVMPGRPSNIVGMHIARALGDEAHGKIAPFFARAVTGEASVFEFTHEESSRRIRVAFTPDRRADTINGVYILSMDVTEETQARSALAQTNKRELAAQMTSGLAHDFSNLLTIILGLQSQLLKMGLAAGAMELVNATKGAARRGGALLDRIAQMSGHREMHPAPTVLATFLRELAVLAGPSLPAGVTLDVQVHMPGVPLMLDAGSLQDSLLNLILNAKDAIGAGPGAITLTAWTVGDIWLVLSVEDNGGGFSDMALTRALDPFFTTKGGEGSGLGLSMVYDLTKLAGGHVRLENGGQGAIVTLHLPMRRAPDLTQTHLVLLVEDSPDIRALVRGMLTDLGHKVIEAASVEEGVALVDVPGISLILSDVSLSDGFTGIDLLDGLMSKGQNLPAMLMTSLPIGDPLRVRAAARAPVIAKPFDLAQLAEFLNRKGVA